MIKEIIWVNDPDMASFLFTNIPLGAAIDICIKKLFSKS